MQEEWREVPGWPMYSVSSLGSVRRDVQPKQSRYANGNILTPHIDKKQKYASVKLKLSPIAKTIRVHQLVMLAFRGVCASDNEVNHINGVKNDNRLDNLEYLTHQKNVDHAVRNHLVPVGSRHGISKLTESDIPRIRAMRKDGQTLNDIAKVFGVSFSNIGRICRGSSWRHC